MIDKNNFNIFEKIHKLNFDYNGYNQMNLILMN